MRKVIAAINMTLDGFCDHTAGIADDELHEHYSKLISNAGVLLYGRITYQLMEYWRTVLKNPTGNKPMDDFAAMIDKIPKIVFSRTLQSVDWASARLAEKGIQEEVLELRQQTGKDILVGSRSLIIQLMKLNLVDEFQLCIHPVTIGKGLPLFDKIEAQITFKLLKTKTLGSGAIVLYYVPAQQ